MPIGANAITISASRVGLSSFRKQGRVVPAKDRELTIMKEEEIVDQFARLAKPRLSELLKLNVQHIYDWTPGDTKSTFVTDYSEVGLKLVKTVQPYGAIERFVTEDKVMDFIVNPGLVPIAKAISMDIRGRQLLVTRKIAAREDDKGVVAHVDGFGVRIMMYFDLGQNDTHVVWECLYGVV
jgi:hypothetical protein